MIMVRMIMKCDLIGIWTQSSVPLHSRSVLRIVRKTPRHCCMVKINLYVQVGFSRSQWPRRGSTDARLLGLWVRILPGAWMFVCCEYFVLSGRGLCDELITRQEASYRMSCVVVCDLENFMIEEPYPISVIELNIGDTSLDVFPTCH